MIGFSCARAWAFFVIQRILRPHERVGLSGEYHPRFPESLPESAVLVVDRTRWEPAMSFDFCERAISPEVFDGNNHNG
jgi:hypothetical protein